MSQPSRGDVSRVLDAVQDWGAVCVVWRSRVWSSVTFLAGEGVPGAGEVFAGLGRLTEAEVEWVVSRFRSAVPLGRVTAPGALELDPVWASRRVVLPEGFAWV